MFNLDEKGVGKGSEFSWYARVRIIIIIIFIIIIFIVIIIIFFLGGGWSEVWVFLHTPVHLKAQLHPDMTISVKWLN